MRADRAAGEDAVDPRTSDQRRHPMCMNCGCGELDERHHPTDITREDMQRAADGRGMSLEETASNVATSSEQLAGSTANAGPRSNAEPA